MDDSQVCAVEPDTMLARVQRMLLHKIAADGSYRFSTAFPDCPSSDIRDVQRATRLLILDGAVEGAIGGGMTLTDAGRQRLAAA
ncbi:MAG: hypothetical protein QOH75_835 [Actinomycetota bacterium]|jgi:hypothetical protein|nr:hypothetical protein [Actinomycetota bacterium]